MAMKIIGIIGIISVFIAIVVYSLLNLQINEALAKRIIYSGEQSHLDYKLVVKDKNGKKKKVTTRVMVNIKWFPFDEVEYISLFRFLCICDRAAKKEADRIVKKEN